ncbi:MAG: glycerol-3-phosphate acyltransferase [Firmicutes bacterium]|nr:glycerol-3-phosphate acyltransferase [Bacillota bacterium]
MKTYLLIILIVIGSYLVGNISFAGLLARLKRKDIRAIGSGNPGTMNMLRNLGFWWGAFTMFLDAVKGAAPALVSYFLLSSRLPGAAGAQPWLGYYIENASKLGFFIGGLPAVVGHIFPVTTSFKGGKGVATSIGVFLASNPVLTMSVFIISAVILQVLNQGVVTSFMGVGLPMIAEITLLAIYSDSFVIAILAAFIFLLVVFAHRSNIRRILNGTENKTYIFKPKNPKT